MSTTESRNRDPYLVSPVPVAPVLRPRPDPDPADTTLGRAGVRVVAIGRAPGASGRGA